MSTGVESYYEDESFRDHVSHIDQQGKRVWFYPKRPSGRLYKWRTLLSIAFLAVLFTVPFITVNGNPLFLFNVIERKFILFGVRFWPQDFFLFVLGMLIFVIFIALFTVVYGRVFCGWVCPQTIFMEMVFRKIEYWIEGDATHQKALNKMPWNAEKIRKKGLKLAIFYLLSFLIANMFLSYIIGVNELYKIITEPLSMHIGGFLAMIIFSGVFFFVFAWFREQACLVVCPYGRMQGVLLDKHSIVVAYDHKRGEPRKRYTKDANTGAGDCIDCHECVRVCPTGIDIRNGTQLECTNCTACIDACDHIMEKVDRPKGLIRYASEYTIQTGQKFGWTTRMKLYTLILFALIGLESFLLVTRTDVDATIMRTRGVLFNTEPDGRINNLYNIKIINKTAEDLDVTLRVPIDGAEIRTIGNQGLKVKGDSLLDGEFFLILPAEALGQQKNKIQVQLWSGDQLLITEKTTFLGPSHKGSSDAWKE
ncbi:MAG: cytochrome c oxidase accessory protein CcoG [Flavobacteriales bacterium]|jgi:cytochrome c oxidase accessory protein FixG